MGLNDPVELPTHLARKDWLKRVLGVERRIGFVESQLGRSIAESTPLDLEAGDARIRLALVKQLAALKQQATGFAAVAPGDQFLSIIADIKQVQALIGRKQWPEAHAQINATAKTIRQRTPACEKLRAFQDAVQTTTLKLDKMFGLLAKRDFDRMDGALRGLERKTTIDSVEAGLEALKVLDSQLDDVRKDAEERLGRLKLLQADRAIAEGEAHRLARQAEDLQLDDVRQEAADLEKRLAGLAESDDETALRSALDAFAELQKNAAKLLEEANAKRLRGLLGQLREQMDEVLEASPTSVEDAPASVGQDVVAAKEFLEKQLAAEKVTEKTLEAALKGFEALERECKLFDKAMLKITKLQNQMRKALLGYHALKEKGQELTSAFGIVPEDLQQPGVEGWSRSEEWVDLDWEYWTFLGAWAKHSKQEASGVYNELRDRADESCDAFTDDRRKASPAHQQAGDLLLQEVEDFFSTTEKQDELSAVEEKAIKAICTRFEKLLEDIASDIDEKSQEAWDIDTADGGHCVKRHGPNVTDTQLKARLSTGRGPDGIFSPAEKSCRFNSYDDLLVTRAAAFAEAADRANLTEAELFGADHDQPFDRASNIGARKREKHTVTMEHPRVIGSGFKGVEPGRPVQPRGQTFETSVPLPPLTKTFTKIVWSANVSRWVVVQHFPTDV